MTDYEIDQLRKSVRKLEKQIKEKESELIELDKRISEQDELQKGLDKKAKRSSFWLFWLLSKDEEKGGGKA